MNNFFTSGAGIRFTRVEEKLTSEHHLFVSTITPAILPKGKVLMTMMMIMVMMVMMMTRTKTVVAAKIVASMT